ncbi:MAG TPA: hypothetical protein P5268_04820 [Candidatus Marinimicrobia bacterium]|nr:hypothetical protein [Candidatus Neomarinimicrobiota bacterium]HRS51581.1 hypothetical protein [Candidatus Neomarinimicrobiota bacterium]HRU92341.1 hypothetical protein [Candidatus Neomarinimicrobiota bacterium]
MKAENAGHWQTLHFIFPDNSEIAFKARLSDAVIQELALEIGQPVFKLKCSLDELYQPNNQIFASGFPYNDLWFRYAQILVIEKQIRFQPHIGIEMIRVIFSEYLRIAECIFSLATFCLNAGLNDVFSGLMQLYESIQQYFAKILNGFSPMDFMIGNKSPQDLPVGFTEMTLNLSTLLQIELRKLFPRLLNNCLILWRFRKIGDHFANSSAIFNDSAKQLTGDSIYDCRYNFPDSFYENLYFDPIRLTPKRRQANVCWQRLRIRCDEIFLSIRLIQQSLKQLVYLPPLPQIQSPLPFVHKGNSSGVIETPWGKLNCQMNCPALDKPCEFTLSNPLYKIRLILCEMAVGLELDELPLLIASLGLRPKIEPQ